MEIQLLARNLYGTLAVYAADKIQRTSLEMITGKKTLSYNALEGLRQLGHTFWIPKNSLPPHTAAPAFFIMFLQSLER